MTTLTETWWDVGGAGLSGKVVLQASAERESAAGGARIVPAPITRQFRQGAFAIDGLEPGLVEVYVYIDDGPSFGKRVELPASGSVRLKELAAEVVDVATVKLFSAEQVAAALESAGLDTKAPLDSPAFTGTPTLNGQPFPAAGGGGSSVGVVDGGDFDTTPPATLDGGPL
ncbi:hypothetical protein GCM10027047_01810 [Rhodococcus aerolatus]